MYIYLFFPRKKTPLLKCFGVFCVSKIQLMVLYLLTYKKILKRKFKELLYYTINMLKIIDGIQ